MPQTLKEQVEEKANELYIIGDDNANWMDVAKHVIASELRAILEELKNYGDDLENVNDRIDELNKQLSDLENL